MVDLVKAREKARKEREKREAEAAARAQAETNEAAPAAPGPESGAAPPEPDEDVTTLEVEGSGPELEPAGEEEHAPPAMPDAPAPTPPAAAPPQAAPQEEPGEEAAPAAPERRYITFFVAGDTFAIPIESIDEIIPYQKPNEVPNVPSTVAGILSLRGRVVTVLDSRRRLGLPPAEADEESRIIVLRQGENLYGLWVDGVGSVLGIGEDAIEDTAASVAVQRDYLHGVHYHKNDMVVLLRLEPFMEVRAEGLP